MCMLFAFLNQEAAADEMALVVASIRDEYVNRPTRQASFWREDSRIIGGMDLESGREGGTWMAMNRSGQIGALLNVLRPVRKVTHGKRNRGFLVPEFLQSGSSGITFLDSLSGRSPDYADFLMVTLDFTLENKCTVLSYYTSLESSAAPITIQPSGMSTFAFGNNHPQKPWIKTLVAQKMFEELMQMMNDETTYFPDQQLLQDGQGYEPAFLQSLSSIRVRIPFIGFGTRTQSVITVTADGKVTFTERTIISLDDYIDSTDNRQSSIRIFRFPIQDSRDRMPLYSLSRL